MSKLFAIVLASLATLQAAPVVVNSDFLGGISGTFRVDYVSGDPILKLRELRFDLQTPLFLDPTFASPGALLPVPFISLTGAALTGFAGSSGIADGATSFTLLFNDFDVNEAFLFNLDLDSPCGSLSCQGSASLVTGSEFAGTAITATFEGGSFASTQLTGAFTQTGVLTAHAGLSGDLEPVPEPTTMALFGMGLVALSTLTKKLARK